MIVMIWCKVTVLPCQIKLILSVSLGSLYKDTSPSNHNLALPLELAGASTGRCSENVFQMLQTAPEKENTNNGLKKTIKLIQESDINENEIKTLTSKRCKSGDRM